ncbi:hypothetical protein CR513_21684, partial [Mucuna pruriens]
MTMFLRENGDIDSERSQEETSTSSSEGDYSSEEAPYEGGLLMMTNLKEKIYFTLDRGSSVNISSQRLVDKHGIPTIPTIPYPKPYKLQWLSEYREMIMDMHVSITITLGKYKDKILYDVVPMEATHVLLGRPWQYDKKVPMIGLVHKHCIPIIPYPKPYKLQWLSEYREMIMDKHVSISITFGKYKVEILCDVVPMEATHVLLGRPWQYDRKVTLKPLNPKKVLKDQIKMKQKRDEEKKEKEKERKEKEKKGATNKEKKVKKNKIEHESLLASRKSFKKRYFPKKMPHGLPPIRGIEHQIDFVPSASFPNHLAYRENPKKSKEIQNKQRVGKGAFESMCCPSYPCTIKGWHMAYVYGL